MSRPNRSWGQVRQNEGVPTDAAANPDATAGPDRVILGDNLAVVRALPDASFQLVYLDPPFNTGSRQTRRQGR